MKRALHKSKNNDDDLFNILNDSVVFMMAYWNSYEEVMKIPVSSYFRIVTKTTKLMEMQSKGFKL